MIKRLMLVLSIFFATTSYVCAGKSTGKVTHIMVLKQGVVIFAAGPHTNKPSCSTVGAHWALSLSSDNGKAMYAMLLSAAAQGQSVNVNGDGTCDAWGDRENPKSIYVNYQ